METNFIEEFEQVGVIGVDAGLCWIGDPCYCVTPDANSHPAPTWSKFCALLGDDDVHQWNYAPLGHAGLGVSVSTGYGDGEYPVYVVRRAGRIAGVFVDFMGLIDGQDEAP